MWRRRLQRHAADLAGLAAGAAGAAAVVLAGNGPPPPPAADPHLAYADSVLDRPLRPIQAEGTAADYFDALVAAAARAGVEVAATAGFWRGDDSPGSDDFDLNAIHPSPTFVRLPDATLRQALLALQETTRVSYWVERPDGGRPRVVVSTFFSEMPPTDTRVYDVRDLLDGATRRGADAEDAGRRFAEFVKLVNPSTWEYIGLVRARLPGRRR